MNVLCALFLGLLTVWDYPARHPVHQVLCDRFRTALRTNDAETRLDVCKKGVALLPDDPTWRYNLACSLAYAKDPEPALDELEKAIDLGFRDTGKIRQDADFRKIANLPRFKELLEYADSIRDRPVFTGPLAVACATGVAGKPLVLCSRNLAWDFDRGCFDAQMELRDAPGLPYSGLLYVNRDGGHSTLAMTNWPGLTAVGFDLEGRKRGMDLDFPNTAFPYPAIGNASRAMTQGPLWRSLPRALMTSEVRRLGLMQAFYLSNQFWVFPAAFDFPPLGTNGNVFASTTPYWLVSQGRSWSDQYYLRAALAVWRALKPPVRAEIVRRGLWAPVLQMLMRGALKTAPRPEDYFTAKANPSAFPPDGLDTARLAASAASLAVADLPPVAIVAQVSGLEPGGEDGWPELTYATPCAWAAVLRNASSRRTFLVTAAGGEDYRFAIVQDGNNAAQLTPLGKDVARVVIDRTRMTPTNHVDVAVYTRGKGTRWSAPSFASFAVVDADAPYSDPVLTPGLLPRSGDGTGPSAPGDPAQ
ncbi:MAG TPA: hypothetical protein DD637_01250 [Verrucomicrobia bacterium]|nr:hypothetical protein [Verrucomicrobiota bacterium]HCG20381.1 hypothetical protein [Verrucomicrobiota bacterium]